jgi:stage V sporulation protein R
MSLHRFHPLTPELIAAQEQMRRHAENYGLDCFPVIFEVVDYDQLNAVAAYGGFPTRYPHWRFGMEYEQLSKSYSYGLSKIYELVINNDPCYAYLMQSNSLTDQKLVMAHVYGHCDFFKNNYWFSQTNRKMMDEMANHGNRVRRYMERFGVETVETFIDACLSVENLIDIYSPFIKRHDETSRYQFAPADEEPPAPMPGKFQAKSYMDDFINPPERLAAEAEALRRKQQERQQLTNLPTRDVLAYLLENAPLKPWQADVLSIIRDEAYYFAPQGQTKIMNEGWATYWHSTIMTRHGLEAGDVIDYADHTAGTLATYGNRLNPYKLGVELFRDIEDRWNRGCFGREYEECDDIEERRNWNTHAGLGREKIFEVRRVHNDITFLDTFLTEDFCREHKLFSFRYNEHTDYYEIESREFQRIKQQLLASLTNMGRPIIELVDGNYKNRGELYLVHQFQGTELHKGYARDTLVNLHTLWGRPVHIESVFDDGPAVLSYDGFEHKITRAKNNANGSSKTYNVAT